MATGLEKLRIYNEARRLEREAHALTANFPKDEKFKMVDQMRRSSASVVNNIAESYGRYNFGEKIHSLQIARGEAYEIRSQIESAQHKKYILENIAVKLISEYTDLIKGISAFMKFLKAKRGN